VQNRLDEVHQAGGEILGISVDSPFSQAKWAEQEGYANVFLSDIGKEASRAYNTIYDELLGMKGISKRSAFLVDKSGTIVAREVMENAKEIPDVDGLIAKMISMA